MGFTADFILPNTEISSIMTPPHPEEMTLVVVLILSSLIQLSQENHGF
jgi:hypothetical protein